MINFTRIARHEFEKVLSESIEHQDSDVMRASDIIKNMALISFTRFAKSNSLYFSLGHTLSTSIIGLHLLNAMRCRDGLIMPEQIINLMASVLFCNVGILRGVLDEDEGDLQKLNDQKPQFVDTDFTDSAMWEYKAFRSKKFIQDVSFLDTNTNFKEVSRAIDYSDFFAQKATIRTDDKDVSDTAKYVRAIQVITLMSDQNYQRKMVEFYLSAKEADLIDKSIFKNLAEFRGKWVQYFWERLYPDVGEEILLLRETSEGRSIVSKMYSHL
tara:strand:- start:142 stop:951 length:810 start_codon:yes stop_codon:yes gene_type:complete